MAVGALAAAATPGLRVRALRLVDFRCWREAAFWPAEGLTVVCGPNGAGKSSLLEAAGLFATLSSPRAGQLGVLVREGAAEAGLRLEPVEGAALEIRLRGGRALTAVGGAGTLPRGFLGRFRAVLFGPEDLDLVRGEPEGRRRAVDEVVVQLRPGYRRVRQELERALRQRNAALRQGKAAEAATFDGPLAGAAAEVISARRALVQALSPLAAELYGELAGRGRLVVRYRESAGGEGLSGSALEAHLRRVLEERLARDLERGSTGVGPHRDDVELEVDGRSCRLYGSRGEQRTVALAVRLAELRVLAGGVLLLDDVLSELDAERRRRLFGVVGGAQVILTTTDPQAVPVEAEEWWTVQSGALRRGRA